MTKEERGLFFTPCLETSDFLIIFFDERIRTYFVYFVNIFCQKKYTPILRSVFVLKNQVISIFLRLRQLYLSLK